MATAKKPAKVMDTVHAGDTHPTPSARPVLVTNRPFMSVDPMLTAEQSGKGEEKPSGEPVAKPSDGPSGAPRLTREGKNLAPVINQVDEVAEQPASQDTTAQETVQNETSEPEKLAAPPSEAEQTVHHTGGIKITPPKHDTPEEPKDEPEEDETEAENNEENPEAARNLELERHIAAGTYFVPIGQVKRRRRKVILLTVFILLAATLALDLLLDMEILKLDSIPHTSFFK